MVIKTVTLSTCSAFINQLDVHFWTLLFSASKFSLLVNNPLLASSQWLTLSFGSFFRRYHYMLRISCSERHICATLLFFYWTFQKHEVICVVFLSFIRCHIKRNDLFRTMACVQTSMRLISLNVSQREFDTQCVYKVCGWLFNGTKQTMTFVLAIFKTALLCSDSVGITRHWFYSITKCWVLLIEFYWFLLRMHFMWMRFRSL